MKDNQPLKLSYYNAFITDYGLMPDVDLHLRQPHPSIRTLCGVNMLHASTSGTILKTYADLSCPECKRIFDDLTEDQQRDFFKCGHCAGNGYVYVHPTNEKETCRFCGGDGVLK